MPLPANFECPDKLLAAHLGNIFLGEYDADVEFTSPPHVLDIGANVGAYSRWVLQRYPGAFVTAYEPNAEAVALYQKNLSAYAPRANVYQVAVALSCSVPPGARLYLGPENLGEASTSGRWHKDEARSVMVAATPPAKLPEAHVVKVDTEGSEVEILTGMAIAGKLDKAFLVVYEYHRKDDRDALEDLMQAQGFALIGGYYANIDKGVQKWARR